MCAEPWVLVQMTYFFSSETSDFTGFDGRNFYRQHTGNFYVKRSEIRKSRSKSGKIRYFSPWNLLPPEISDGHKILFLRKYDMWASFCTSNQVHNSKTRKSHSHQSLRILANFGSFMGYFLKIVGLFPWFSPKFANFDESDICEFLSYVVDSKCKIKLKPHIFWKLKNWNRRNFWRQQISTRNMQNLPCWRVPNWQHLRNFESRYVRLGGEIQCCTQFTK